MIIHLGNTEIISAKCVIFVFDIYLIVKMIRFLILSLFLVAYLATSAQQWVADSLGNGYEMSHINLGKDYHGDARCTLVRHKSSIETSHRGILYIHGYNDYFFQTEMGLRFAKEGYNFYALELRRYGRSLRRGDKPFIIKEFTDYFQEVDKALDVMRRNGCDTIVLMGHSTGGLLASYYMATHPEASVDILILNSPFLDWNLGKLESVMDFIAPIGSIFPNIPINTGGAGVYAESLLKSQRGEWEFDMTKKSTDYGVNLGWIRAIHNAQQNLRKLNGAIKKPILLMFSFASSNPDVWSSLASSTDVVLSVRDIQKYGSQLGPDVTQVAVKDGLHDLLLSRPTVRYPLYNYIFEWLDKKFQN